MVMNMNQDLKVEDMVLLNSGCRGLTTVLPSISNSSGVRELYALLYSREYSVRSCFLPDRTYAYPSIPCARVRKWIQKLLKPRKFQDLSGHYWMEVVIHTKEWDFQKGNGYFWACMTASFSTSRNSFLCVSRAWVSYTWECKSYFASLVDDKGCS